ncbi:MAG: hypothetical protein EOO27_14335 [Comamonadaceae bacterium]|nr:MAG: hypothetical protein EOO27_14335 [Comamonadaceae bacterium]
MSNTVQRTVAYSRASSQSSKTGAGAPALEKSKSIAHTNARTPWDDDDLPFTQGCHREHLERDKALLARLIACASTKGRPAGEIAAISYAYRELRQTVTRESKLAIARIHDGRRQIGRSSARQLAEHLKNLHSPAMASYTRELNPSVAMHNFASEARSNAEGLLRLIEREGQQ